MHIPIHPIPVEWNYPIEKQQILPLDCFHTDKCQTPMRAYSTHRDEESTEYRRQRRVHKNPRLYGFLVDWCWNHKKTARTRSCPQTHLIGCLNWRSLTCSSTFFGISTWFDADRSSENSSTHDRFTSPSRKVTVASSVWREYESDCGSQFHSSVVGEWMDWFSGLIIVRRTSSSPRVQSRMWCCDSQ